MVLELYADLSLGGLISDVRVFKQLLCVRSVCIVFHQTIFTETVKFLGPDCIKKIKGQFR